MGFPSRSLTPKGEGVLHPLQRRLRGQDALGDPRKTTADETLDGPSNHENLLALLQSFVEHAPTMQRPAPYSTHRARLNMQSVCPQIHWGKGLRRKESARRNARLILAHKRGSPPSAHWGAPPLRGSKGSPCHFMRGMQYVWPLPDSRFIEARTSEAHFRCGRFCNCQSIQGQQSSSGAAGEPTTSYFGGGTTPCSNSERPKAGICFSIRSL